MGIFLENHCWTDTWKTELFNTSFSGFFLGGGCKKLLLQGVPLNCPVLIEFHSKIYLQQ